MLRVRSHCNSPFNIDAKSQMVANQGSASAFVLAVLAIFGLVATFGFFYWVASPRSSPGVTTTRGNETAAGVQGTASTKFPVIVNKPVGPPQVLTGLDDVHGNPITVACATCHSTRPPNTENKTGSDLDEFHASLTVNHGSLSCLSCHNPSDYDSLKLADGSRVEFTDVMTLCAQCHGSQMRDFEHGVHGGMNGYWDLSRGPQTKNNCVDCHQPHHPRFPKMQPTFKPRDRFLEKADH